MKQPTAQELLTVQTQADADEFARAFPQWVELPANAPQKAPILAEIEAGGRAEMLVIGALVLVEVVVLVLIVALVK